MAETKGALSGLSPKGVLLGKSAEEYDQYLAELKSTLDARKNRSFDPSMLAMAAGFLSPTQTGGFGESLANAMKGYTQSQAVEEKQDVENAAMRMQIAQAENEQRLRREALQGSQDITFGLPTGAPKDASPVPMFRGQPITLDMIVKYKQIIPELGKAMDEALKTYISSVKTEQGGAYNVLTGKFEPFGGQGNEDYFIPGDAATGQPAQSLKVTKQDKIVLDKARSEGDGLTFWTTVDKYTKRLPRPSATAPATSAAPSAAPSAPSTGGAIASGAPSTAQPSEPSPVIKPMGGSFATTPGAYQRDIEAETAGEKTTAEVMARKNAERTQSFMDQGAAAIQILPEIRKAKEILKNYDLQKLLAVLEGPTVKQNIGKILSETFKVGNYTAGLPAIREVLANAGTDQNLINAASLLAQTRAYMDFQMRQGLGSGTSVSNFEQQMVNQMGPSERDTPDTYMKKLLFMEKQAEFRQNLANALDKTGMSFNKFSRTGDFTEMFDQYQKDVIDILGTSGKSASGARSSGSTSGASKEKTREELKKELEEIKKRLEGKR